MLNWLKSWFKQPEVEVECEECNDRVCEEEMEEMEFTPEVLLRGMEFAIEQMQMRQDDMVAIVAALLLDKGSSEYVITQDFLASTLQEGLIVKYEFTKDGHLRVWTELKPEPELEGDFEEEND